MKVFSCIALQDLNNLTKTKNIFNFQLKIDLTTIKYTDILKNA